MARNDVGFGMYMSPMVMDQTRLRGTDDTCKFFLYPAKALLKCHIFAMPVLYTQNKSAQTYKSPGLGLKFFGKYLLVLLVFFLS